MQATGLSCPNIKAYKKIEVTMTDDPNPRTKLWKKKVELADFLSVLAPTDTQYCKDERNQDNAQIHVWVQIIEHQ